MFARPKLAIQIAAISATWTETELYLIRLLQFTSIRARSDTRIASAIFYSLGSLKARLDIVDATCKLHMPDDMYTTFRDQITPDLRRRARERAKIIHGKWGMTDDLPDALLLDEEDRLLLYQSKDFSQIQKRLSETAHRLFQFGIELIERGPAQP
jgi:hypothetical protein